MRRANHPWSWWMVIGVALMIMNFLLVVRNWNTWNLLMVCVCRQDSKCPLWELVHGDFASIVQHMLNVGSFLLKWWFKWLEKKWIRKIVKYNQSLSKGQSRAWGSWTYLRMVGYMQSYNETDADCFHNLVHCLLGIDRETLLYQADPR